MNRSSCDANHGIVKPFQDVCEFLRFGPCQPVVHAPRVEKTFVIAGEEQMNAFSVMVHNGAGITDCDGCVASFFVNNDLLRPSLASILASFKKQINITFITCTVFPSLTECKQGVIS